MSRGRTLSVLAAIVLLSLACNIPVATGIQKMTPLRFDTSGDRRSFSGEYSCEVADTVILIIDENGVASLSTTGPVFVDYINCLLDPSGFEATYIIVGLADPDSKLVTFTSCNDGAFSAEGSISYQSGSPVGNVSCTHSTGSEAGKIAIMLWVPADR
jgi:hypothetical protein